VGCVPFHGAAWLRPVYLGLLVPHIVLAALVVPLALTTIYRAWRGHFDRHRRLARVTLPIWLYVSVSGVLVYVLLYDARSLRRNGRRRRVLVPLPIGGRRAALNGGDDEKAALRVEVEEDAPVPEAPTIGPERLFRETRGSRRRWAPRTSSRWWRRRAPPGEGRGAPATSLTISCRSSAAAGFIEPTTWH